ncbi:hypothetical protein [Brevibacillus laterosporus]|uniref:hypothetical protein n=1 Tax=Brevibacillus laterosporus TaxID=1465 RepID=UPI00215BD363|nr:hypothetical protein [Brevibacillus laterosporus]MCR8994577.1 hypothetical protein [Brevibacillus laterosporus]
MKKEVEQSIKEEIESWFAGYEAKRVSNHLERVEVVTKVLKLYNTFFGFVYDKKHTDVLKQIPFTYQFHYSRSIGIIVLEKYKIDCAVDERQKIIYWKAFEVELRED